MKRRSNLDKLSPFAMLLFGSVLAACSQEPPAHTVDEFVSNPRLLEATMVRCAENRIELKYTEECSNARDAVDRIAPAEAAEKKAALEAESARKREALRRARQAAVEARARAEEAERLRREAEYLSQFEPVPAEQRRDPAADTDGEPPAPQLNRMVPASRVPADDSSLETVREELRRRQQPEN